MRTIETVTVLPIDDVVLFPETQIIVYVSDSKTIQLLKENINNDKTFAVCLSESIHHNSGYSYPQMTGCLVTATIVKSHSHGAIYVLLTALQRIHLTELIQNIPHIIYSYKVVADTITNEHKSFKNGEIISLKNRLLEWSENVIEDSVERDAFNNHLSTLRIIVNYACMNLIDSAKIRQSLLENPSLFERVHVLTILLEQNRSHRDDAFEQAFSAYKDIEKNNNICH
jgi:ATP-dependent Lon protease